MWPKHAVATWKNATGGETFERSFWRDVKDRNWDEVEHHLAANCVWVTPGGRQDRAAALQYLQTLRVKNYAIGDLQSELNGDTFVVSYTLSVEGTAGGETLPSDPIRMMTVWQHEKSGWVAIAHSQAIGASK